MGLSRQVMRHRARKGVIPRADRLDPLISTLTPKPKVDGPDRYGMWGPLPNGENRPDKGKKDGSCNRTACQRPLKGAPQFWMRDHPTGGRLYYCGPCEVEFTKWDKTDRPGEPLRCTPDEDNDKL